MVGPGRCQMVGQSLGIQGAIENAEVSPNQGHLRIFMPVPAEVVHEWGHLCILRPVPAEVVHRMGHLRTFSVKEKDYSGNAYGGSGEKVVFLQAEI